MTNADQRRSEPLVSISGLDQFYGRTQVLHDCSLEIARGEVHALVGENGSGKSTVVKLLSGVVSPSSGLIRLDGRPVHFDDPATAQSHGIVTVFQETLTAETCSVSDNVMLGTGGMFRRTESVSAERETVREHLQALGLAPEIISKPTRTLSLADRQVLTIARALARPWKLLVLDEATSALDFGTRDRLFSLIRDHVDGDRSVLFVSHRMDELAVLMNRATVQRSGRTIETLKRVDATTERLLQLMSGNTARSSQRAQDRRPKSGEVVVSCKRVSLRDRSVPFDLFVDRGEVLGVAGLDGHGAADLLECLAGLAPPANGEIHVSGDGRVGRVVNYRQARRARVAYVPGRRQDEGLFPTLDVNDNALMATIGGMARMGLLRRRAMDARSQRLISDLGVNPPDHRAPIGSLSGGNAQKVLVGRWLATSPRVLLLNDPLRGVDLGTKRDFYRLLEQLSAEGMTVIMFSTEIEELLHVSDRIAVCRTHSVSSVIERADATGANVLEAMFGHSVGVEAGVSA